MILPFIGNMVTFMLTQKKIKDGENALMETATVCFEGTPPPVYGFAFFKSATIVIADPNIIEELYVSKNRYFDKHPRVASMFMPCLGDSILLARSNDLW
jgi:hypothetical protein